MPYLLKGGTLLDGTGGPPKNADLTISGPTIVSIGSPTSTQPPQTDNTVFDIEGCMLAPGFIDVHAHSDLTLLCSPQAEGKVLQGITTEVNGNCGFSAAPLFGEAGKQREPELASLGIAKSWEGFREYFGLLEAGGLGLNTATLAGHGNIRASAMGYEDRAPTPDEMKAMLGLLDEAAEDGVIGLSTGLIYPPGVYAAVDEILALAGHMKGLNPKAVYTTHMRSEGDRLIEAIGEAISVGRASGIKVQISHIKTAGRRNWHKIEEVIALIEQARAEGVEVTCDRYPYTAGSTGLDAVLPAWVYEGGADAEMERLTDSAIRERIRAEAKEHEGYWGEVVVSTVTKDSNRWMEGLGVSEIADRTGTAPIDAVMDLLVDERLMVDAVFHSMSEENLRRFLALPYVMPGTDSSARPLNAKGRPHPRGFGTYPRYLSRYTAKDAASLAHAVHKATLLPARTFGLKGRGELKEGNFADLVVFDPRRIKDTATYQEPKQAPQGIRHVFVNGTPVVAEGRLTGALPGKVLRHGG